ncbi:MAG: efflux RND transporter permease subunit, partial [bacterium]|nr:efflux RND transporter permease subunit [bacterium]
VEAARAGARQITFAATAATAALIAIFLPVAFMKGIVGKFFYQHGVTISVAVALSLLEALTLTPMRTSQFLTVGPRKTWFGKGVDSSFHWLTRNYKSSLGWALDHRWTVVFIALLFFSLSLVLLKFLRKEFLPSQDQGMLLCRLQTPVGASIEFTSDRVKKVEEYIMSRPETDTYFAAIGGFTGGQVNTAFIFVTLKPPKERPVVPPNSHRLSQSELMVLFRNDLSKIPDLKVVIQDLSLAGFTATRGFPIEFTVQGPDWDTLIESAQKLREEMSKSKLMVDVDSDYLPKVAEIRVWPNRKKAAAMGVNVDDIGSTINALIGGEPIAKFTTNGRRYDVRIRLLPQQRNKADDINSLQVWNNHGELVNLKEVVDISQELTSLTITRRNRERAISLFANVAPGQSQTTALAEVNNLAANILPPNYHIVFTGSAQTFQESFTSLLLVLFLGIIVSYMVLGSQFNSYIHPIAILLSLPFSISGALVALWLTSQSINMYSLIGIILLMGIVKKNAILLVDFTNQYREQKMEIQEALLTACPIRLRPILMTSLATIAAAIPPALALGPGAETRVPMAIAVIGGVIFSTMLTLYVVPCSYSLFGRIERKKYGVIS